MEHCFQLSHWGCVSLRQCMPITRGNLGQNISPFLWSCLYWEFAWETIVFLPKKLTESQVLTEGMGEASQFPLISEVLMEKYWAQSSSHISVPPGRRTAKGSLRNTCPKSIHPRKQPISHTFTPVSHSFWDERVQGPDLAWLHPRWGRSQQTTWFMLCVIVVVRGKV